MVELSCFRDITSRVRSGSSRTVGNICYSCRSNNPTRRGPLIYEFGSIANAYPENDNPDYVNVFAITSEITWGAEVYGSYPYADPQEIPMDDEFRDATLEVSQDAVDFFLGSRVLSNLSCVATLLGYPDCQITNRCAFLVVARIVLVPGVRRGDTTDLSQYLAMMVLWNSYKQVIAFNTP